MLEQSEIYCMEQIRYLRIRYRNSLDPIKNSGPHIDPVIVKHQIVVGVVRFRSRGVKPLFLFAIFIFGIISRRILDVISLFQRKYLPLRAGVAFYPMQCHIYHMILNPQTQDQQAHPNLPVGTVNIDALARHAVYGLKQELE